MSSSPRQSPEELARRCAHETQHFFERGQDPCHSCLVLFRLAIIHQDEEAWEWIYQLYAPLVKGWVLKHPAFHQTGEDADAFVNGAFARMWKAITPEKCADFNDIKSVLRYLQICTHSAILDVVRQQRAELLNIEAREAQRQMKTNPTQSMEERIQHRIYCKQAFQAIQQRMKTPQEHRVLYEMFVLGLKPSEILAKHPELFRDAREIYRVKENILARLRRDKDLHDFLA
ncbi:MAG TPA: sigma-70 family RNA polymerase sigma factor [Anaerolineae bacterium]|nr:sigma-70 family RNA polymerase sigma factor [Anaerolineae bacterium]